MEKCDSSYGIQAILLPRMDTRRYCLISRVISDLDHLGCRTSRHWIPGQSTERRWLVRHQREGSDKAPSGSCDLEDFAKGNLNDLWLPLMQVSEPLYSGDVVWTRFLFLKAGANLSALSSETPWTSEWAIAPTQYPISSETSAHLMYACA